MKSVSVIKRKLKSFLDKRKNAPISLEEAIAEKAVRNFDYAKAVEPPVTSDFSPPSLPKNMLLGFLTWLKETEYEIMTYEDLAFHPEQDEVAAEFSQWTEKANESGKKYILLQYDMDANCEVSEYFLRQQIEIGVPSNLMVFRKKMFDFKLKQKGIVEEDPNYVLNFPLYEKFAAAGGVIGYHCNAFERAGGNQGLALEIFEEDVRELRKHLDIKFFSMHGGLVDKFGMCNGRLPVDKLAKSLNLLWVHNGKTVYFSRTWADGGLSRPSYRKECSNPTDFVLSTQVGERTRLLFHPQYYKNDNPAEFSFPVIADAQWVQNANRFAQDKNPEWKRFWQSQDEVFESDKKRYLPLLKENREDAPIFINGMSRSGTTLLASMLDAHGDIGMAYESYPRYLIGVPDEPALSKEDYLFVAQCLVNYPESTAWKLLDNPRMKNFITFAAVSNWTGMSIEQIGRIMRVYLSQKSQIFTTEEALHLIAGTARYKLEILNKSTWGSKASGEFQAYHNCWPNSRFVYIERNGLDVLASQMTTGAFNPDARKLGQSWKKQFENFNNYFSKNSNFRHARIKYESLVTNPTETIEAMCRDLELDFDPAMISQHLNDNTLLANPRGQLSAKRVAQPIDTSAVDRWKKILEKREIDEFFEGCGGRKAMIDRGYDV